MMTIFAARPKPAIEVTSAQNSQPTVPVSDNFNANSSVSTPESPKAKTEMPLTVDENSTSKVTEDETILSEEQALDQLPGIPLYFPTSYSLVKPYVQGFDINILDAPSLKDVRIDNSWQPKQPKSES
jgi:hypothetical protein